MYCCKGFKIPLDLPLMVSLFFLTVYYSALIRIFPIRRVLAMINKKKKAPRVKPIVTQADLIILDKLYRGSTFLLRRLFRNIRPCLRRTLVMYRWSCRKGLDSCVVIGVSKASGTLQSHAWLEIAGVPFGEKTEELIKYTPILEG